MANVLVIGASRGVGLETVKQALEAGHAVRAFARSANRIQLQHERLEKVEGDALSRRDVEAALDGVDAVIQTLGVQPAPKLLLRRTRLFSDATRILVEPMERNGVRRLVCLTGFGAGDSRNQGGLVYDTAFNLFLRRVYDDKNLQEYLITIQGIVHDAAGKVRDLTSTDAGGGFPGAATDLLHPDCLRTVDRYRRPKAESQLDSSFTSSWCISPISSMHH